MKKPNLVLAKIQVIIKIQKIFLQLLNIINAPLVQSYFAKLCQIVG